MNELSKELLCVYMRPGIEIWVERERAQNFINLLASPNAPQFTEIDGNLVNRADITGIFTASAMDDMKRRKNGQWQCEKGKWHGKQQECACRDMEGVQQWGSLPEISDEDRERSAQALAKIRAQFNLKTMK